MAIHELNAKLVQTESHQSYTYFEIPMGSWEQTAQERSKWRSLINQGAALCEEERSCEAERKHRERKAKTKGPPADYTTLTCSICNQLRARNCLGSHQRAHQHTWTSNSRNNDGLSFSERRTTMILYFVVCNIFFFTF